MHYEYYRMLIKNQKTGETKTYVSKKQGGSLPYPWKCISVLGGFNKSKEN